MTDATTNLILTGLTLLTSGLTMAWLYVTARSIRDLERSVYSREDLALYTHAAVEDLMDTVSFDSRALTAYQASSTACIMNCLYALLLDLKYNTDDKDDSVPHEAIDKLCAKISELTNNYKDIVEDWSKDLKPGECFKAI